MTDDILIPTSVAELRTAVSKAVEHRWALRSKLERAQLIAAPYEGMGIVANFPQLGPARRDLKDLPPEIEQADRRTDDLIRRLSEKMIEDDRADREVQDFWFRRFMLSLQIGNGAAFLATVAGLLQADKSVLPIIAALAWPPAMYFAMGVTAAGLLPLLMAAQRAFPRHRPVKRGAYIAVLALTTLSMGFFAVGAATVVVEIWQLGQPARDAALAAPTSPTAKTVTAPQSPLSRPSKLVPAPTGKPETAKDSAVEARPGGSGQGPL